MLKKDLIEKIKDITDDVDINETLQGIEELGLTKPFDVNKATVEDYKNMLANNEVIKAYYQSSFDSAVGTAVTKHDEKFKKEKLPGIIEEEIKKRDTSNLTPEQLEIKELKEKMAKMEADKEQAEKLNVNTQLLKNKDLPIELAKYVNDENDITLFENVIKSAAQKIIDEKLGKHRETPPKGGTPNNKMSLEEIMAYANEHPGVNIQNLINQNR